MKEIRVRCWIENDGQKLFGPGPCRLLELIDKKGSISIAAKEMGMSYKKAWDMVNRLNTLSQSSLVISHKGGQKGGGAALTAHGRQITIRYKQLMDKLNKSLQEESEIVDLF